ncbi:bacterial membrane protein YfhO [Geobacter sp. OR-1]|uniref:YfhO family protein n=1 Tax=Geobacter sp. OR-1 TaxID=1266765 RepID=UPI0005437D00|nr:YfhO family protein [Geobacter sp. OR-1]GAM11000.1 bacterial membrane protein YfhO [Geobacter sp. OR-1]
MLALQFFNSHWQIAYYTCLGIAVYGVLRLAATIVTREEQHTGRLLRLIGGCLVAALFFLSTVSISLIPITQWSKDTNRGVQSGSNQGKGGLAREEAMMWSLPPEELGAFVIPGFFGLSRQEGGENPTNIRSYYWGRMVFTQTVSYMGLLPWLLVPLPLIFRRDRYTWIALAAIAGSLFFSMGQYTPFYNFLYDHFPGINRFRVPKMMMFMTVMGLGVMAARGLDLLLDAEIRARKAFRRYLAGIIALPVVLLLMLASQMAAQPQWLGILQNLISEPNRYEQGPQLLAQRWGNLVFETGFAAGLASLLALVWVAFARSWIGHRTALFLLFALFLADVWRIDDKFTFLIKVPKQTRGERTPVIDFLAKMPKEYRVLPMDGTDPMQYVTNKIPVFFTSNAVQSTRWQEFLDVFSLNSAMPDIMNIKYLIQAPADYQAQRGSLANRFEPVFTSPDGGHVILENRYVLPKAWLVPSVVLSPEPGQLLGMLQSPGFDPRRIALVESAPPIPLPSPAEAPFPVPGAVQIDRYEGEHVSMNVSTQVNSILVMGDKYYRAWKATDNGKATEIYPVDRVLRGVYLTPGNHRIEFVFAPWSFRVGSSLTYASFALYAVVLGWEWRRRRTGYAQV